MWTNFIGYFWSWNWWLVTPLHDIIPHYANIIMVRKWFHCCKMWSRSFEGSEPGMVSLVWFLQNQPEAWSRVELRPIMHYFASLRLHNVSAMISRPANLVWRHPPVVITHCKSEVLLENATQNVVEYWDKESDDMKGNKMETKTTIKNQPEVWTEIHGKSLH